MSDYRGLCARCSEPVRGACARELDHAWELERSGGGAHAVHGPDKRFTGRVMHPVCHSSAIALERSGLVGQESMLLNQQDRGDAMPDTIRSAPERLTRREIEELFQRNDIPLDAEFTVSLPHLERLCPDCVRAILGLTRLAGAA